MEKLLILMTCASTHVHYFEKTYGASYRYDKNLKLR